ncbi:glycerophosphodiester phosphodiesterase [Paenibacillus spiritus]|uniref:Glycerophosphodiester phosphodiesterase n=1 Tax=Paenibacillus spiritus TaxID=2496557 RepID=A0A5J5GAL3_9BACL|nr:glycerophosphodiester phosphodiesterase [Paenibacillus spiritus]KAA9004852.1 glycerophosphodiester phosphodiesterase [Paenibacillus spiritus]
MIITSPIINFAHRGASRECPENTMAAFRRAVELGATGIETDVQMTRDGRLVLIHDERLERTTNGKGWVKDQTWEELAGLDAGSWFKGGAYAGERIPLLEDLLELALGSRLVLNIELKNGRCFYPGMEQKVIAAVRACGLGSWTVISSFNHYSLALCRTLAPEIGTGILYSEGLYRPWAYAASLGAGALHAEYRTALPELVREAAACGVVFHPWTVNEPAEMSALIESGVAGIITDEPGMLSALLERRLNPPPP